LKEIVRPARFTAQDVVTLAAHLTERDRQIALDCFEHRVLTTDQIKRLHFTDTRTTVARLDTLYRLRVLDRFRPSLPRGRGTAPYHWILDEAGALIAADCRGVERAKLGWQHAVAAGVATSPKLAHHVEVNEFVVRLAVETGRAGGWLSEWYGERTLHDFLDGEIIPDSYAVLRLPDRPPLHVFVELDRGTETLERLQEKATRYRKALRWRDVRELDPLVLLLVPSAGRSRSVTTALAGSDAPFAVVVWSKHSTGSVLTAVLDAEAARAWERRRDREDAEIRREAQAQAAAGTPVEGLRPALASDLLDHPQQPE
jgi:hypothetical protein